MFESENIDSAIVPQASVQIEEDKEGVDEKIPSTIDNINNDTTLTSTLSAGQSPRIELSSTAKAMPSDHASVLEKLDDMVDYTVPVVFSSSNLPPSSTNYKENKADDSDESSRKVFEEDCDNKKDQSTPISYNCTDTLYADSIDSIPATDDGKNPPIVSTLGCSEIGLNISEHLQIDQPTGRTMNQNDEGEIVSREDINPQNCLLSSTEGLSVKSSSEVSQKQEIEKRKCTKETITRTDNLMASSSSLFVSERTDIIVSQKQQEQRAVFQPEENQQQKLSSLSSSIIILEESSCDPSHGVKEIERGEKENVSSTIAPIEFIDTNSFQCSQLPVAVEITNNNISNSDALLPTTTSKNSHQLTDNDTILMDDSKIDDKSSIICKKPTLCLPLQQSQNDCSIVELTIRNEEQLESELRLEEIPTEVQLAESTTLPRAEYTHEESRPDFSFTTYTVMTKMQNTEGEKVMNVNDTDYSHFKRKDVSTPEVHGKTRPLSKKKTPRKFSNKKKRPSKQRRTLKYTGFGDGNLIDSVTARDARDDGVYDVVDAESYDDTVNQQNMDANVASSDAYLVRRTPKATATIPSFTIILDDDEPCRLVNPLAELGPPINNGIPVLVTPSSAKKITSRASVSSIADVSLLPRADVSDEDDFSLQENMKDSDSAQGEKYLPQNTDTWNGNGIGKAVKSFVDEQPRSLNKKRKKSTNRNISKNSNSIIITNKPTIGTRTATPVNTNINTTSTGISSCQVKPPSSYIQMNDWLPLHDIWFCRPDTYPVSYWARLLGFSLDPTAIPLPSVDRYDDNNHMDSCHRQKSAGDGGAIEIAQDNNNHNKQEISCQPSDTSTTRVAPACKRHRTNNPLLRPISSSSSTMTVLTKEEILRVALASAAQQRSSDTIYQIQASGTFGHHIWKNKTIKSGPKGSKNNTYDDDEIILGSYRDPLYMQLVHWNNADNATRSLILGKILVTSNEMDQTQNEDCFPYPHVQRRGSFFRRSSGFLHDRSEAANVVVVPVSTQEHSKMQLPIATLEGLVADVHRLTRDDRDSFVGKGSGWMVRWKLHTENDDQIKMESQELRTDPLAFLSQHDKKSRRIGITESDPSIENGNVSSYSFHTFSQARILYPELSEAIANIIALSSANCTSLALAGVMDGWIAIEHHAVNSTSTINHIDKNSYANLEIGGVREFDSNTFTQTLVERLHAESELLADDNANTETSMVDAKKSSLHEAEQAKPVSAEVYCQPNTSRANGDNTDCMEIDGSTRTTQHNASFCVNQDSCYSHGFDHLHEQESSNLTSPTVSVAAYLTYQFVWFRDQSQAVEESELIARVFAVDAYRQDQGTVGSSRSASDPTYEAAFTHPDTKDCSNQVSAEPNETEIETELKLILTSLMVAYSRINSIWYAVFHARNSFERIFFETFFRMKAPLDCLSATDATYKDSLVMMICDMQKISARYSMLAYRERLTLADRSNIESSTNTTTRDASDFWTPKRRWLLRLPSFSEAKAVIDSSANVRSNEASAIITERRGRYNLASDTVREMNGTNINTSPRKAPKQISVQLRVKVPELTDSSKIPSDKSDEKSTTNDVSGSSSSIFVAAATQLKSSIEIRRIERDGTDGDVLEVPCFATENLCWKFEFLRTFLLPPPEKSETDMNLLLEELKLKQNELDSLEKSLESRSSFLLKSVIDERIEFENAEADMRRLEEIRVLAENKKMLERRKELDQAWQKQLEQDMDAVCAICNDGEVTPDNQILFCDSCNVSVHQLCYGIERVPDGDYYCQPCKRLNRDRRSGCIKPPPQPLPICCELCPLRQGAFVRTDAIARECSPPFDKWVHSVCAKWQGLSFVDPKKPDLLEDVSEIKVNFRRHGIKCDLCQGEYGAMNKCMGIENNGMHEECNSWFHITCARAVGTLRVIHGENCKGPVKENPWKLMCPLHSSLSPGEIIVDAIPVEKLILAAQEFPPEPRPPPEPVAPKPFNTATGREREYLLARPEYENALITELLTKKFFGVRCEVCDLIEDDSKNLTRCVGCLVVFCMACKIDEQKGQNYMCPSCVYLGEKRKLGEGNVDKPQCAVCYQQGGFLTKAFANPISKQKYWKNHMKEFKNSLFGKQLWTHSICAFWHPKLILPYETGLVDLSNVVLANGKDVIQNRIPCYLCGLSGGMKVYCAHDGCLMLDGKSTAFHVTCARQAGLEVGLREGGDDLDFYVYCYRHGGNMFNLRARLEDMIEFEKRRAGKDFSKADAPMNFSNASKVLNSAVHIVRILGWAWRWAEWWVEYDSSWEPLLELGQREEEMTKEELKIVESTKESRCEDARRCRLAAFGAAIRNRDYDNNDGFDNISLNRALRAIFHTRSLVGPLQEVEIDFFVDWLSRAYRSKSRLLYVGQEKNMISKKSSFCLHSADQSPKFILGDRPIPGKQELDAGQIFESNVIDVDDFLSKSSIFQGVGSAAQLKQSENRKQGRKRKALNNDGDSDQLLSLEINSSHHDVEPSPKVEVKPSRRPGRPSKGSIPLNSTILNIIDKMLETEDKTAEVSKDDAQESKIGSGNVFYSSELGESKRKNKVKKNKKPCGSKPKLAVNHEIHNDSIQLENLEKRKKQSDGIHIHDVSSKESNMQAIARSSIKQQGKSVEIKKRSFCDISKWNATNEAKQILLELLEKTHSIPSLLSTAVKRGVRIEEVQMTTGEVKGTYTSMAKASIAFGIHHDKVASLIRGDKPSLDEGFDVTWRYSYQQDLDLAMVAHLQENTPRCSKFDDSVANDNSLVKSDPKNAHSANSPPEGGEQSNTNEEKSPKKSILSPSVDEAKESTALSLGQTDSIKLDTLKKSHNLNEYASRESDPAPPHISMKFDPDVAVEIEGINRYKTDYKTTEVAQVGTPETLGRGRSSKPLAFRSMNKNDPTSMTSSDFEATNPINDLSLVTASRESNSTNQDFALTSANLEIDGQASESKAESRSQLQTRRKRGGKTYVKMVRKSSKSAFHDTNSNETSLELMSASPVVDDCCQVDQREQVSKKHDFGKKFTTKDSTSQEESAILEKDYLLTPKKKDAKKLLERAGSVVKNTSSSKLSSELIATIPANDPRNIVQRESVPKDHSVGKTKLTDDVNRQDSENVVKESLQDQIPNTRSRRSNVGKLLEPALPAVKVSTPSKLTLELAAANLVDDCRRVDVRGSISKNHDFDKTARTEDLISQETEIKTEAYLQVPIPKKRGRKSIVDKQIESSTFTKMEKTSSKMSPKVEAAKVESRQPPSTTYALDKAKLIKDSNFQESEKKVELLSQVGALKKRGRPKSAKKRKIIEPASRDDTSAKDDLDAKLNRPADTSAGGKLQNSDIETNILLQRRGLIRSAELSAMSSDLFTPGIIVEGPVDTPYQGDSNGEVSRNLDIDCSGPQKKRYRVKSPSSFQNKSLVTDKVGMSREPIFEKLEQVALNPSMQTDALASKLKGQLFRQSTSTLSLHKKCARKLFDLDNAIRSTKSKTVAQRSWKNSMLKRFSHPIVLIEHSFDCDPNPRNVSEPSCEKDDDGDDSIPIAQLVAKKKSHLSKKSSNRKYAGSPPKRKSESSTIEQLHAQRRIARRRYI